MSSEVYHHQLDYITQLIADKKIYVRSGKGMIRKRGGGKCEGCNVRFENLETVSVDCLVIHTSSC
jgi:transcriptional regulator NrdR family protein